MPGINHRTVRNLLGTITLMDLQRMQEIQEYADNMVSHHNVAQLGDYKRLIKRDWETLMVAKDEILDSYLIKGK